MNTTVTLKKKEVYGNALYYPANTTAELVCKLVGTKTVTKDTIHILKEMGYSVELEQETL